MSGYFIDRCFFSLAEPGGPAGQHLSLHGQPPVGRGQPVPEVVVGRQLDRLKRTTEGYSIQLYYFVLKFFQLVPFHTGEPILHTHTPEG